MCVCVRACVRVCVCVFLLSFFLTDSILFLYLLLFCFLLIVWSVVGDSVLRGSGQYLWEKRAQPPVQNGTADLALSVGIKCDTAAAS